MKDHDITPQHLVKVRCHMIERAARLTAATRAQSMVEYALLTGFVAVTGALTLLAAPTTTDNVQKVLNNIAKYLALAAGASAQAFC